MIAFLPNQITVYETRYNMLDFEELLQKKVVSSSMLPSIIS